MMMMMSLSIQKNRILNETSPNADDVVGVRGRVRGQRVRGDGRGRTEKLFDRVFGIFEPET